jgi:hypothetical protein
MAVGDDAQAAGYALVPDTGEEGRIRWGSREVNRTRDYIAQLKTQVPSGAAAHRTASGITSGSTPPDNSQGQDGDIYFQIL